jgi:hypothetical protein
MTIILNYCGFMTNIQATWNTTGGLVVVAAAVAAGVVAVWRIIPYCGLAEFYGETEADTRLGRCVH